MTRDEEVTAALERAGLSGYRTRRVLRVIQSAIREWNDAAMRTAGPERVTLRLELHDAEALAKLLAGAL